MIKTLISKGLLFALFILFNSLTLFSQVANPVEVTTDYLQEHLKDLQLTPQDISDFQVQNQVVSRHNKVTHLYLKQQHQGIPVHNAILNINILENGEILSMGNRFLSELASRVNGTTPGISMEEAVKALMTHFQISNDATLNVQERISPQEAIFDPTGFALDPIRVKLVYQPLADKSVRLAWNVTFSELSGQNWWNARIDAQTGKVIDYFNQIIHCDFGPHEDICDAEEHAHLHKTMPQPNMPPPVSNAYRVFPLTVESPNHGTRTLEENPADPTASPFGWHDTDGNPGHEYTITRGNNVHAYHDIFNQNSSTGGEPDGGDSLLFDFPLDLALGRPYTQLDPATTNLFYWNNLMHDVWYQYGFDEASGNFQANNYGNGGIGSDHVQAEALDGSGTNNANFGTPTDGDNPRMQMFLWGGGGLPTGNAELIVLQPEEIAGNYEFTPGSFGGELPSPDAPIISEVVLVTDSTDTFSDACEPILNGDSIAGKIALIDRGNCEFGFKSLAAENAGAIAVIICNNVDGDNVTMAPGAVGDQVTIPAIFMSMAVCNTLKMGLPGLEVQLSQGEFEVPDPGPAGLDSDLDNGVIAHEYTHGISIRLTGGAGNSGCLTGDEQAGEGWSDWFALVMTTTPDMTAEQPRGIGTYVIGEPTDGIGIRTFPYSRDMSIDPHTYADINGESIPHGVGSVWCVMIWDLFWNLVDVYGYDADLYHGTGGNNIAMQLVLDGLKLQGCNPSFIEARDGIIDADIANNGGENVCLIWETFARRGLGVDAQAGGVESFDTPLSCRNVLWVEKTAASEVDAGGVVTYEVQIFNGRNETIEDAIITDMLPQGTTLVEGSSSCDASVDGNVLTLSVGTLASGVSITCSYQLQVPATPFSYTTFEDDVDGGAGNWDFENPIGSASWSLNSTNSYSGIVSFFAPDITTESDQYLILSDPFELTGPAPALSFWHNYDTEANWDGGVVEISTNGTSWVDLGDQMIQNGYDGPVNENPASPISSRPAFHGSSDGWIQTIIDLSDYAGDLIQVRFRMACDGAVGGVGWYVDDIAFLGNLHTIENIACIEDEDGPQCSRVSTIVYGDITNSTLDVYPELGVDLFPNPTNSKFTLQFQKPASQRVELSIMNIDGRELLNRSFNTFSREEFDMTSFGAGIYLVRIKTEAGITTKKLIVQ